MDTFTALLAFLLSLFGVDTGESRFEHRLSRDGVDVLHSRAVIDSGVARFECLHSATGHCVFELRGPDCGPASAPACGSTRLVLADGDSHQLTGVGRLRLCVGIDADASSDDCTELGRGGA